MSLLPILLMVVAIVARWLALMMLSQYAFSKPQNPKNPKPEDKNYTKGTKPQNPKNPKQKNKKDYGTRESLGICDGSAQPEVGEPVVMLTSELAGSTKDLGLRF